MMDIHKLEAELGKAVARTDEVQLDLSTGDAVEIWLAVYHMACRQAYGSLGRDVLLTKLARLQKAILKQKPELEALFDLVIGGDE